MVIVKKEVQTDMNGQADRVRQTYTQTERQSYKQRQAVGEGKSRVLQKLQRPA